MANQIPPDVERRIQAQISGGLFSTGEEVLREAMDALECRQRGLEQARHLIAEADADLATGQAGPFHANQTTIKGVSDGLRFRQ